MNYRTIYAELVSSRKNRSESTEQYYESHHIKPRCFGGDGDCRNHKHANIVRLTVREHFIAHLLLTKIYPGSLAMHKALWMMCNKNRNNKEAYLPSSRMFEKIRGEYILNTKGEKNHMYGKKLSQETKIKIGLSSMGRKPFLGRTHSDETKKKISKSHIGFTVSKETKQKISNSTSGSKHYKAKPIVCLKTGTVYGSGVELSAAINKPFSSVRAYLNGRIKVPEWFHYKRVELLDPSLN